ncbi:MAG: S1C family serine protease [Acholeplasmataceae bacterium]|jgi:S1-C subfamily serine protease|nr:S1C family serine protease [Acholeplasmataceae bacterium]
MRKKLILIYMLLVIGLVLTGCSFQLRAEIPYTSPSTYEEARIEMIRTVEPSVVVVKSDTGHGSGIIFKSEDIEDSLDKRYYVLTNHHVIEDGGEIKIHFGNSSLDIAAKDVASYEPYDIAVVRFETSRPLRVHPIAPINDNSITQIVKGQDVYAIGTPEDIQRFNYVTQGIVSLTSYPYNGVTGLAIMHDAELNPGNSGGPLFNLKGEVIGINVAKVPNVSTQDGLMPAEGLNYSLSINKISPIVSGFTEADYKAVERKARLGVTVQDVAVFLETHSADLLPPDPVGVVVLELDPTRNAKDFIEVYDLIIAMNDQPITSIADISAQLEDADFGDEHTLTVMRKVSGSFVEFTYTIILS